MFAMTRYPVYLFGAMALYVAGAATINPAAAADRRFEGDAYAQGTQRLLYREEHWVYDDNGVRTRLVLYRCPAGAPFARKLVKSIPATFAPDFDFVDNRNGYREGVRSRDGQREIFVQKNTQSAIKTAPLPLVTGGVIDADFDAYVRSHWSELSEKRDLRVQFLVPSRLAYLDLRLGGATDGMEQDEAVRHLHMRLDAWFGGIAPSIELTYAATGHRLLRFEGIGNIRDDAGKIQKVRIEFPAAKQFAAPARAEIDAAVALALTGRCPE
jgi:hypothetical protein